MAKFEIYKDKSAKFRWRMRSGNNEIIATSSESYERKAGAVNCIEAIKREAGKADVVEVKK